MSRDGFSLVQARRLFSARIGLPLTALILVSLLGAGCAKVGDPQPPEIRIPAPASDLAARQLSDFVVLTVSKPERNVDGSSGDALRRIDVLRRPEPEAASPAQAMPEDQFLRTATRILSIPATSFSEHLQDDVFVIEDRLLPENTSAGTFRYGVLFVNHRNQSAGLSNQAVIRRIPIPRAPDNLKADVTQDAVVLTWSAPSENIDGSTPPRITGYNIYKAEDAAQFPARPLNPEPVQGNKFEDRDFRFGATYRYAVSIVASTRNPAAETLPSEAVTVVARDVFPPEPPGDFNALLQGNAVVLLWTPSPSKDVAGYRVYRIQKGTAERRPVAAELIAVLSYRDTEIEPGKEYSYQITAVDRHGNEGPAVMAEVEKR